MISFRSARISERPSRSRLAQRTFLAFLSLAVLGLLTGRPLFAGPAGTITFASGTVMLKRPGNGTTPASRGDAVFVADDVICGENSVAQVTLADGAFVNLFPGTSARVNQFAFDPVTNRRTARLKVDAGKARFVLFKVLHKDSAFFVETNSALLDLDMIADVGISVTGSETTVAALAASVSVRNASRLTIGRVKLGMNQKTVVREKAPPGPQRTVTPEERKGFMKNIRHYR